MAALFLEWIYRWYYLIAFHLNDLLSNIQYGFLMHQTAPSFLEQADSKALENFLNFSTYPTHVYYYRYYNGQYNFLIHFIFSLVTSSWKIRDRIFYECYLKSLTQTRPFLASWTAGRWHTEFTFDLCVELYEKKEWLRAFQITCNSQGKPCLVVYRAIHDRNGSDLGPHWKRVCLANYSTLISLLITQVSQLLTPVSLLFTLVSFKKVSG